MASYLETADLTETALIGHAVAGDKSAFTALVARDQNRLLETISRELTKGDSEQAADLAQQALLDVYRTLETIDRDRPFFDSVIAQARTLAARAITPVEENFTDILGGGNTQDRKALKQALSEQGIPGALLATQEAEAALQALLVVAQVRRDKHAPGIGYLFAICVRGHTIEQIARREKTTPDQIETAVRTACQSMRGSLKTIMAP
ncbi:MAG: hypothetical protein HYS17_10800 [Micavibrio aeruginosavorus]|uniref:Uncharacterized protein n=1 Tax=Micavibrio aeruginosavorus TaxID=349221 RepID=A0A7T5R1T0_9BACT|nr:MAG: hypothetical protein HYS17_10800 [Micavibrio aeruginosavorus]